MPTFFDVFVTVSVVLTLVIAIAIVRLLYSHFSEQFAERQRVRKFAADLPQGERAAFWREYKLRKHLPRRTAT